MNLDRISYRAKKQKEFGRKPNRKDSFEADSDRNRVSTDSPDSYDLSMSMETKILSSDSSAKDRDKLVPVFRQSYVRNNSNQYQLDTQMANGV